MKTMDISWVTLLGLIAATFTTIAFVPQVIKTLKSRQTKDISLGMYVILTVGLCLWCIYGALLMNLPIILADVIALVFSVMVLVLKVRHG